MKKSESTKYRLGFISPWLLTAAVGIIILIIAVFSANNIRREKDNLTQALFHKGQAIIRFVGAGTRSMMMMGQQGALQIQRLIEQASEDNDIHYIAVMDESGRIVAHSDPQKINSKIERRLGSLQNLDFPNTWQIIADKDTDEKVFEVVSPFNPFRMGRRRFMKKRMKEMFGNEAPDASYRNNSLEPETSQKSTDNFKTCPDPANKRWCRMFTGTWPANQEKYIILVGLDIKEYEAAIRQDRRQIVFLSLALLLVGIGGWLSLLTAQGYRVSQNTLHQIQAFTDRLISRLPVGIIATDKSGFIKTYNQVAATMTGISADKAIAQHPDAVFSRDISTMLAAEGHAKIPDKNTVIKSADNRELSLQLSSVPIADRNNHFMGRVLLMQDMTEIKKLENELHRHDRLAALGKMAAGVAHEVRNPLSSIKGFATLLSAGFVSDSEEKKAADLLINEVERLNRSITELLNYTKPLPLKISPTDIKKLLYNSLRLIESDAGACNININNKIAGDLPLIPTDPDKMNQVFLNLFLNAIQAMPDGGTLTVEVQKAEGQKDTIEIIVRDTGCGIPEENLAHIFDPYFSTKTDGTGLGLAMVYKIIEEHGGTIRLESETDRGTIAKIKLPTGGRQE